MDDALQERLKAEMALGVRPHRPAATASRSSTTSPSTATRATSSTTSSSEHLWTKVWVLAGRAEDVAAPGDYMTFDDLGLPILLVRGKDGVVRAFYNTCQHRGAPVVRDDERARRATCAASTTRGPTTSPTAS